LDWVYEGDCKLSPAMLPYVRINITRPGAIRHLKMRFIKVTTSNKKVLLLSQRKYQWRVIVASV